MTKIALSFDIPAQELGWILCTAIEGGSNYWAQYKNAEVSKDYGHTSVQVIEYGDEVEAVSQKTIKAADLVRGIKRIVTQDMNIRESHGHVHESYSVTLCRWLISPKTEYIDSELADLILQATMFGHIKYG
jgi:hypothetical protein